MSFFYKYNELLESKVTAYFEKLNTFNAEHLEGALSVILLGSLSRGEGTWINQNGMTVMLSDIEFFTIYPDGFQDFSLFENYAQALAQEIFSENSCSLFHVDNTFVSKSELSRLEKKLLTFDAGFFGKCLVGQNVMDKLPEIDIHNINLYDIRDILTHRAFSVLYYGLPLKNQGNKEQYQYSLAKNSLDLMTVLLVEKGLLISGFLNRLNAIQTLDYSEDIKSYLSYCLAIKLGEETDKDYSIEEMEDYFLSILKLARKNFKLSAKNALANRKHILKRKLGVLKRSLQYRHLVIGDHLRRLISHIERNEPIGKRETMDNLVLNGYPTEI